MKSVFGIILGGFGLIAAIYAVAQASWSAKNIYEEVTKIQNEIEKFESQLDEMEVQTIRFGSVKAELEAIEQRILNQDAKIEIANVKAETQAESLRADISALASRLPTGVSMPEVQCLPLKKRIRVGQHSSVEFCDSDLIVSISQIRTADNVVNLGNTLLTVPKTTNQGFAPCEVDFMSINRDDPENPTVDIRGRCPE